LEPAAAIPEALLSETAPALPSEKLPPTFVEVEPADADVEATLLTGE